MEGAILATDLAVYSKNNEQLKGLLTNGGYDIKKSNHRYENTKHMKFEFCSTHFIILLL